MAITMVEHIYVLRIGFFVYPVGMVMQAMHSIKWFDLWLRLAPLKFKPL